MTAEEEIAIRKASDAKPVKTPPSRDDAAGVRGEADGKQPKGKRGRRKGVPASDVKEDQRIADAQEDEIAAKTDRDRQAAGQMVDDLKLVRAAF